MTTDAWLTLGVLVVLFGLLIWDRWPTWIVFSGALAAILTLGLATETAAVSGFSNTGVLTVVVLYVVAAGMYRTGAISLVIGILVRQPRNERDANLRILPATAFGSAFLNNTPIVAMLVPVVHDIGRSARLSVSKIYMSVSDSSILGGASTLIGTSTNLIIAGLVADSLGVELGIFFPTRVGLPVAILGILLLVFVAGYLLKTKEAGEDEDELRRRYRAEFFLPEGSHLAGDTVAEAGFSDPVGSELMQLTRDGQSLDIEPDLEFVAGDELVFEADIEALPTLWSTIGLVASNPPGTGDDQYANRLVEAVVSNRSELIDAGIDGLLEDDAYSKLVGMSRAMAAVDRPLDEMTIAAGDNLVLEVTEEGLEDRREDLFALTRRLRGYRIQRVGRAWLAGLVVVAMVLLSAFGIMSLFNAALLAVAALLVVGAIGFRSAWDSIDWKTYVILACAVGLEPAVTESGLADVIADGLSSLAGGRAFVALVVVYLGAVLLTNVVTNAAAAALMFPITIGLVESLGVPWEPYIAILMLGCSYAFINPAGYQTHLMIQKPGGYSFMDFVRVGVPLTLILGVVAVPLAALLYGL
jgi:di/tricarboxylate transporter